jgi:6-phosphogluconate dehydrogenase
MEKEIGIIGLGKMGGNVARRLAKKGWHVVGYNRTADDTKALEKEGIDGIYNLNDFRSKLDTPRTILLILTAGKPTDEVLEEIVKHLEPNDIIVEGANSFYLDTQRRADFVKQKGLEFIDAGVSGGPGGALNGACLMVGGDKKLFAYLEPLFVDMAKEGAVMHFDGVGAGHFVKMVHNGIEYGMMQSIAEGFNLLKNGPYKLKMTDVTTIYQNGSVVQSRLVGWLHDAFVKFGDNLEELSGAVGFTGEGAWTAQVAKKLGFPAPIIEGSVKFREESQKNPSFIGKILTGMRNQFGGHSIEKGKMT